jgi:hypothetical protein
MITPELDFPLNLTVASNTTSTTQWFYVHGYSKLEISAYWTGSIAGTVTLQGTNEGPVGGVGSTFQPEPTAVQIFPLDDLVNTLPAGTASTAGTVDDYENVLPKFVRLSILETATEAGTLVGHLVAKSTS